MKGDLISRSALLKGWNGVTLGDTERQIIMRQPAEDAELVVHGHLRNIDIDEAYCEMGDCSVCGCWNPIPANYCRGCGAKMDKEET